MIIPLFLKIGAFLPSNTYLSLRTFHITPGESLTQSNKRSLKSSPNAVRSVPKIKVYIVYCTNDKLIVQKQRQKNAKMGTFFGAGANFRHWFSDF